MKPLAKALALFSGASFVSTCVQIVKGKLGAVLLGTAGVGILSQCTYLFSLFYTVSGLGLSNGITRRVVECHERGDTEGVQRQVTSAVFTVTALSLCLALIAGFLAGDISHLLLDDQGEHANLVALILAGLPFAVTAQVYRSLLSGMREVKAIVRAQITADVASVVAFAVLIITHRLPGAVAAFVCLQVLKVFFYFRQSTKLLKDDGKLVKPGLFSWSEVTVNAGYGATGLLLVTVGISSTLLVSRFIIENIGLDANGVFSVGWNVSTVYLATLYASAGSYYFPSLVATESPGETSSLISETVALYMYVIPPVAAVLMMGGKLLITALFSADFAYAAVLLLLLLPGDLFRISAETINLSLFAKNRLLPYTALYLVWASVFVTLSWYGVVAGALMGVALAYLVSQVLNLALSLRQAHVEIGYVPSKTAIASFMRGLTMLALVACIAWWQQEDIPTILAGSVVLLLWVLVSLKDRAFRDLFKSLSDKLLGYLP